MPAIKDAQQRAAIASKKEERARDGALAMKEYEAEKLAVRANAERLRALRLAREAAAPQPVAAKLPAKTAATKQPAKAKEPAKKTKERAKPAKKAR